MTHGHRVLREQLRPAGPSDTAHPYPPSTALARTRAESCVSPSVPVEQSKRPEMKADGLRRRQTLIGAFRSSPNGLSILLCDNPAMALAVTNRRRGARIGAALAGA